MINFKADIFTGQILSKVTSGLYYKTFLVGEARNLPQSGAPERCFTRVGSGLTQTMLEMLTNWCLLTL
jgi:hypothetical protein